jgi:hypothetical protein
MEVGGYLRVPVSLLQWEESPVPIGEEGGWALERFRRGGEDKYLSKHASLVVRPVAE